MSKLLHNTSINYKKVSFYNNHALFIVNFSANALFLYLTNKYILSYALFEKSLGDRLEPNQLNLLFIEKDKVALFSFFGLAAYLIVKYVIVAFILQVAADFQGLKLTFPAVVKVVMSAELVFAFQRAVTWILFMHSAPESIEELRNYVPLSLSDVAASGSWQFALQTVSIWEVFYCILLVDGIGRISGRSFREGFSLVISSYVPCLFAWTIVIAFLTFTLGK